jgi:hypothetical protein
VEATAGLETVPERVPVVPVSEEEIPLEESVPVTTEALAIELPRLASITIIATPAKFLILCFMREDTN